MVLHKDEFIKAFELAKQNMDIAPPTSLDYAQRARVLLTNFTDGEIRSTYEGEICHMIQVAYHQMGAYPDAYAMGLNALEFESELTRVRAGILRYLANTLHYIGLIDKALEACEEAYQIALYIRDEFIQAEVLISFGLIYDNLEDYEKQLTINLQALEIYKRLNNESRMAVAYNNVAHSYLRLGKYDEARLMLAEAIDKLGVRKADRHASGTLITLGELHMLTEEWDAAEKAFRDAYKSAVFCNRGRPASYAVYHLAILQSERGKFKSALSGMKKALDLSEKTNMMMEQANCHQFLYKYYNERKAYKQALYHMELCHQITLKYRDEKAVARTQILMAIHDMERIQNEAVVAKVKSEGLEEMVKQRTEELQTTRDMTLQAIAALVETRDVETGNHIKRTALHVKLLIKLLVDHHLFEQELNLEENQMMPQCAMLHDIGKVGIPDAVLLKPGKFTSEEFEIMKQHTLYGYQALRYVEEESAPQTFLDLAAIIAISHHEKWDGSGYPNRLSGDEIPLPGRIMAIVDVYDALVSKRHYKDAYSHSEAIRMIEEEANRHFDPRITEVFVQNHEIFRRIALRYADSDEEREQLQL